MYAQTTSSSKDNTLRAIRFETPEYIPMTFHINEACYHSYPLDELFELVEKHKFLFPYFKTPDKDFVPAYPPVARKDQPYTDDFGCIWETTMDGITGTVNKHPLDEWSKYDSYSFPDPTISTGLEKINWKAYEKECDANRSAGNLVYGDLRHGHTFLQLCDLRGYENVIFDMMDKEPLFFDLVQRLEAFNLAQIEQFIKNNVDIIRYPEDLGMQIGPMLSLECFVKYIKPSYQRLMQPARDNGIIIHMHSDGDIRVLVDEIIDGGVDVINLQDIVNGIDWIGGRFRGKTCVDLDIDRQQITLNGSPADIDQLIRDEVEKIGCKQGGLMMVYGLYPGVPLENVKALMDAMERYAFHY